MGLGDNFSQERSIHIFRDKFMRKQTNSLKVVKAERFVRVVAGEDGGRRASVFAEGGSNSVGKVPARLGVSSLIPKTFLTATRCAVTALVICGITVIFGGVVAAPAEAAPIYVVKEVDGSIRFTDRKPADPKNTKVFTASSNKFGHYSISPLKAKLWNRGASRTSSGRNSSISHRSKQYEQLITQASQAHNLDPALVKAVIHAESSFNPQAISPNGAIGLMQLMPTTAKRLGVRPHVPEENIKGGVRYLSALIQAFKGNLKMALAAYNAGEGAVRRYQGIPPYEETQTYVKKVLALRDVYLSNSQSAQG